MLGEPESFHMLPSQAPSSTWIEVPLFGDLPYVSLHLVVVSCTVSFIKLIKLNAFLSFVSHSIKLIEPKRKVVGTPNL